MTDDLIRWTMTPKTRSVILAALAAAAEAKRDLPEVAAEYDRVAEIVTEVGQADPPRVHLSASAADQERGNAILEQWAQEDAEAGE